MGTPPEDVNIESNVIGTHQLVMLCHPEHALAKHDRPVAPEALIKHQLIAREVGSGTRLAMAAFFGGLFHQAPKAPLVLDSNEAIKQAIMANMGVSLLSDSTCHLELGLGLIHHIPVQGTPLPRKWYAVRTANTERNPAEESLHDRESVHVWPLTRSGRQRLREGLQPNAMRKHTIDHPA
jgi:DNA-binding transcriptional LysR family regulator